MHNCYLQQGGFCRSVDLLASRISQKLRDRSQQNCVGGWNGPRKNEIDEGILIKGDCQHCLSAGPEYKSLEWHFWYCFSVVRVSTHRLRECSLMPLRNVGWMCRLECHCGCFCVPLKTKNQKNVLYNKCFCQSIGKKKSFHLYSSNDNYQNDLTVTCSVCTYSLNTGKQWTTCEIISCLFYLHLIILNISNMK